MDHRYVSASSVQAKTLRSSARFVIVAGGAVARGLLAFSLQVLLAKTLPLAEYGQVVAALAVVNLITPIAGFGLSALSLKHLSEGAFNSIWVKKTLTVACYTCLVSAVLAFAWSLAVENGKRFPLIILLLLPSVFAQVLADLLSAIFQIESKLIRLSLAQNSQSISRLLGCAGLLFSSTLLAISVGFFITGIFAICLLAIVLHKQYALLMIGKSNMGMREDASVNAIIKSAAPFAVADIIYAASTQLSTVALSSILSAEEMAAVGITMTVMTGIYLIPVVTYQRLYLHKFHKLAICNKPELNRLLNRNWARMAAIGGGAAMAVWLFSDFAINKFFGPGHSAAIELLKIIAAGIPARFAAIPMLSVMATGGFIGRRNTFMLFGTLVSVSLMLVGGGIFGLKGVGWTMVACEFSFFLLYLFLVKRAYFRP